MASILFFWFKFINLIIIGGGGYTFLLNFKDLNRWRGGDKKQENVTYFITVHLFLDCLLNALLDFFWKG